MIRVTLFGRFSARSDTCQVPLSDGSKAQQLFAFLLLDARRARTRDAVASILWSDHSTEAAKAYLRKALWQLRWALEKCEPTVPAILRLEAEWIQVNPEGPLWVDTILFERAHRKSCDIKGEALDAAGVEAMQEAVDLYQGGVLPNCYEPWCVEEQERYRTMYLGMREKLMEFRISQGQHDSAIEQGKQILRCDVAHEQTHRRLMWLYHARHDRTRALGQFRVCKEALTAELGVEPSRQTTELYKAICENTTPFLPMPAPPAAIDRALPPQASPAFRIRVCELSASLAELQKRINFLLSELDRYSADDAAEPAPRPDADPSKIRTLLDMPSQRSRAPSSIASIRPVVRSKLSG